MNDKKLHLGFRALGDPVRRQILELIRDRPHTVNEISDRFTISRPAISQHLAVLHHAELVTVEQGGTSRHYTTNPAPLQDLRHYIGTVAAHTDQPR